MRQRRASVATSGRRWFSNRPEVRPALFAPPAGACAPLQGRPPSIGPPLTGLVSSAPSISTPSGSRVTTVPALDTSSGWVNGIEPEERGSVVMYQLWTFGCFNCTNTLPYLGALWDHYRSRGLAIVGIHSPEFAREADPANVAAATERLGVTWPVLLDPNLTNWRRFGNRYWPRTVIADAGGRPWFDHAGEGAYDEMEDVVRHLLRIHPAATRATNTTVALR